MTATAKPASQRDNTLRRVLQFALPILVLGLGVGLAWLAIKMRSDIVPQTSVTLAPLVEVLEARPSSPQITVEARGTVRPATETTLTSEVSGRIEWVAPEFEVGGFFAAGAPLARIDSKDYELARIRSEAEVADAEFALALEVAEAKTSVEEWEQTSTDPAPPLVRREPQLAAARARVAAAEANLDTALRDLERTTICAPYQGRVRQKSADVGAFVSRGTQLAQVYSVEFAEVRLPLEDAELAFVDLPIAFRDDEALQPTPVRLSAEFAGKTHVWHGEIVRTEGELDARSRLVHAIARVADPYGRRAGNGAPPDDRPPLLVGMYVRAAIAGRQIADLYELPRSAVRDRNKVLIVRRSTRDAAIKGAATEDTASTDTEPVEVQVLELRTVEIARTDRERVYISAGLAPGELVCTTRLQVYTDGMEVRVFDPDAPTTPEPAHPGSPDADHGELADPKGSEHR